MGKRESPVSVLEQIARKREAWIGEWRDQLRKISSLPDEGKHEMGWRDPETGMKEDYLKRAGILGTGLTLVGAVLDEIGPGEVKIYLGTIAKLRGEVEKLREELRFRKEFFPVTSEQVKRGRALMRIGLGFIDGDEELIKENLEAVGVMNSVRP